MEMEYTGGSKKLADAVEGRSKVNVAAKSHTELQAPGRLHELSSKKARTSMSILNLPVGILELILQSACVDTRRRQADGQSRVISKTTVGCISRVCTRWRDLVRSSYKRARCESLGDLDVALSQLHTLRNVTQIHVSRFLEYEHLGFLRGLATGFPLLTSFSLNFFGNNKDLEVLSLFLSLKTDIRELSLYTVKQYREAVIWDYFKRALERLDFTPQVHLKKLTLGVAYHLYLEIPDRWTGGFCIPVSTTLTQLAGLEELHISVDKLAEEAPLPPWLAELPAFVGLRLLEMNGAPCSSFLNSLGRMTRLKELVMTGVTFIESEMDAVSKLSHLTSLVLEESSIGTSMTPFCLTTTLRELSCPGEALALLRTTLPLLEELTLTETKLEKEFEPTYFARTPNVRSLTLFLREERGAGSYLEHLTGLTSLCVDEGFEHYQPEEPIWHICEAQVHALQVLELRSCKLLLLIDGLLSLEGHVAVSVRCTCPGSPIGDRRWFSSHAEHVDARSTCHKLPAGVARQLFRGTRRPTPKAPLPCFTFLISRDHNRGANDAEEDVAEDDN